MIEKIFEINITDEIINGTKFEQVSGIARQPYFATGTLIILAVVLLIWFIWSFQHITKNKMAWSSFLNWKSLIFIFLIAILYIFIFVFPVPTYWID